MNTTTTITDTRTDDLEAQVDLVIYELDQLADSMDLVALSVHCSAPAARHIALTS